MYNVEKEISKIAQKAKIIPTKKLKLKLKESLKDIYL